jgi:hypothetical protein
MSQPDGCVVLGAGSHRTAGCRRLYVAGVLCVCVGGGGV